MKKQVITIVSIVLVILVAIFALMNLETVEVSFGFTSVQMPLVLLILICLLLGAFIIFLFSTTQNMRKNREYRELENTAQQQQDALSSEIHDLQETMKALETRLKNSSGKQEIGVKDQQINDLETKIQQLNDQLTTHK